MTEDAKTFAPINAALFKALAEARDRCEAVAKDGFNKHFSYAYASSEDIFGEARAALEASGLSLMPMRSSIGNLVAGVSEHGEAKMGGPVLERIFLLVHASGSSIEIQATPWPILPGQGRPLDKATAIAATTQLAYTLRDLLLMRRGGDDQDESEPVERPALAPKRADAAPRPETARTNNAGEHARPTNLPPIEKPIEKPSNVTPMPTPKPVLEAPAATPPLSATPGVTMSAEHVVAARLDEDERIAAKFGDDYWEHAQPLCDGDLAEIVSRDLAKAILSVGATRHGSVATALESWSKVGIAPRAVPTRAQLRAFVLRMPSEAPAPVA